MGQLNIFHRMSLLSLPPLQQSQRDAADGNEGTMTRWPQSDWWETPEVEKQKMHTQDGTIQSPAAVCQVGWSIKKVQIKLIQLLLPRQTNRLRSWISEFAMWYCALRWPDGSDAQMTVTLASFSKSLKLTVSDLNQPRWQPSAPQTLCVNFFALPPSDGIFSEILANY